MVIFKYKKDKSGILRPVANITIQHQHSVADIPMYIDSGADISIIPRQAGEFLGFTKTNEKIIKMKGLAGFGVPYIEKDVTLVFDNKEKIKATIAWVLIEEVPALLGRKNVFNKFKIIFDEQEEKIEFHRK